MPLGMFEDLAADEGLLGRIGDDLGDERGRVPLEQDTTHVEHDVADGHARSVNGDSPRLLAKGDSHRRYRRVASNFSPKSTSAAPNTRSTHSMTREPFSARAPRTASWAYDISTAPSIVTVTANMIASCGSTGRSWLMNCGSSASTNSRFFGFVIWTARPCSAIP